MTTMAMTYVIQLAQLQLQVSYKTMSILKGIILKYFLLRSYKSEKSKNTSPYPYPFSEGSI